MTQKPRTLPKMFKRTTSSHTPESPTPESSTPDFDDTYFISDGDMDSPLFDDTEAIIVVEEDEVLPAHRTPSPKSPQVVDAPRPTKTTPPHTQTPKGKAQTFPPLPPRKMETPSSEHLRNGVVVPESNSRSAVDGRISVSENRSENSSMVTDSHHQVESTRTESSQGKVEQPKPKQKRYRSKQFTDRDKAILEAVYWLVKSPLHHISFAIETKPILVHQRLRELSKRGYIRTDTSESLPTFSLTRQGLTQIGRSNEKPVIQIARSTFAHRNQINTAIVRFKMGDKAFQDLMYAHELTRVQEHVRNNRKYADYNSSLAVHQSQLLSKPVNERTVDDLRVLAKKPRALRKWEDPVLGKHDSRPLFMNPQAAFPERLIQQSLADTGEMECVANWKQESEDLLHSTVYPVKAVGDNTVTEADRKAMMDFVEGKEWIFRHWNLRNEFKKRHMPDGVILQPNQQDANGTVYPMSWWLEVETNKKSDNSEIVRVIEQAFDSPVVRGVIYMTGDPNVARVVKKARSTVAQRLAHRYRQYEGMSHSDAEQRANEFVSSNCLLIQLPALYPHQPTQFWG
ncbi:hypothetical protein [Glutamicibacter ardleyensis]|uniref:hypothetical protein n=1 Tax=Glutamicibacter ardleyensis TaxID=225894 RepID=UPI003FD3352F